MSSSRTKGDFDFLWEEEGGGSEVVVVVVTEERDGDGEERWRGEWPGERSMSEKIDEKG